jgi:MOSC domain-containing protein YiiM
VNVGQPQKVEWRGKLIETGIFKEPVIGRRKVGRLNIEGDRQADLNVHGGPDKAVYGYPSEHYAAWMKVFPNMKLPWGMFGENLTTEGLSEESLHIGDVLRAGTALLRVTQPRMPCYKLGIKFGTKEAIAKFWDMGLSGFYFSVAEEGDVAAGDAIEIVEREARGVSIAEFNRVYEEEVPDAARVERLLAVPALPQGWRSYFKDLLAQRA